MPGGLPLGPPADVIDGGIGQLDGVEVVDGDGGSREARNQGVVIAPVGIDGDHLDVIPPVTGAFVHPT